MVRDDDTVMQNISALNLPEVIELRSELPELFNVKVLLGTVYRWKEIRDYFKRPVRIYGSCSNRQVERYLQQIVTSYTDIYLTVVPEERKEILDSAENSI